MKWPFRRHTSVEPPTEAQRAHYDAIVNLAVTEARGPEVSRVSRSLRAWREENHIVAQLDAILGGRA